jgi:hypothetical protein
MYVLCFHLSSFLSADLCVFRPADKSILEQTLEAQKLLLDEAKKHSFDYFLFLIMVCLCLYPEFFSVLVHLGVALPFLLSFCKIRILFACLGV